MYAKRSLIRTKQLSSGPNLIVLTNVQLMCHAIAPFCTIHELFSLITTSYQLHERYVHNKFGGANILWYWCWLNHNPKNIKYQTSTSAQCARACTALRMAERKQWLQYYIDNCSSWQGYYQLLKQWIALAPIYRNCYSIPLTPYSVDNRLNETNIDCTQMKPVRLSTTEMCTLIAPTIDATNHRVGMYLWQIDNDDHVYQSMYGTFRGHSDANRVPLLLSHPNSHQIYVFCSSPSQAGDLSLVNIYDSRPTVAGSRPHITPPIATTDDSNDSWGLWNCKKVLNSSVDICNRNATMLDHITRPMLCTVARQRPHHLLIYDISSQQECVSCQHNCDDPAALGLLPYDQMTTNLIADSVSQTFNTWDTRMRTLSCHGRDPMLPRNMGSYLNAVFLEQLTVTNWYMATILPVTHKSATLWTWDIRKLPVHLDTTVLPYYVPGDPFVLNSDIDLMSILCYDRIICRRLSQPSELQLKLHVNVNHHFESPIHTSYLVGLAMYQNLLFCCHFDSTYYYSLETFNYLRPTADN